MSNRTRRPTPGTPPGVGRAPSVARLWPETAGAAFEAVLDGTTDNDRREAADLARRLRTLFQMPP